VIAIDTSQGNPRLQKLPLVEIFETVEGEGMRAGFPTTFIRLFNCNLRCSWCDTKYSYAPAEPTAHETISDIVEKVTQYGHHFVCLTGGEPLLYTSKVLVLLEALAELPFLQDIHIETGGGVDILPFQQLRQTNPLVSAKVRFILDYKLPKSGESTKMVMSNYTHLQPQDEIKFVIADEHDFTIACTIVREHCRFGTVLFSPVWETMPPEKLVKLILVHKLHDIKLSMQIHKTIWDPNRRGV